MSTDLLFVYGTLRRSDLHPMHGLLSPATLIGTGEFRGQLYHLGNYPGAVPSTDPGDVVVGEVYRLHDPAATLARLDRYEGCMDMDQMPTEYVRVVAGVLLAGGDTVTTHIYLYQRSVQGFRRIKSGDFFDAGY